jgi:hypothetical protein
VDPGTESWIKGSNTIGSKKEDATIVFESSEEDGHDGIPLNVSLVTFLQKYVGFIQKENATPPVCQLKVAFQVAFDVGSRVTDISACDRKKWSLGVVCDTFCCRSLTNACCAESVGSKH